MRVPIYLVLIASLGACIPIGIRGTSVVDAGSRPPAVLRPAQAGTARMPGPEARAVTERASVAVPSLRSWSV